MDDKVQETKLNNHTLLLTIYLMYKLNMISRISLKEVLDIIKSGVPDDLAAYLVKESMKS